MSFRCRTCGELHDGLPHLVAAYPEPWFNVPEGERDARVELTSDTCIIDGEHFFIRGIIQIPIHGAAESFGLNVWVSQKHENFETYVRNFESADIGPFFGWLSNSIRVYTPDTFLLKTFAHFRGGGLRPTIELEPTDHPLAIDQRQGITLDRAWEIVHQYERDG